MPDICSLVLMAILEIESVEVLEQMLAEHGAEVMGDIPNFTDTTPIVQISENLG